MNFGHRYTYKCLNSSRIMEELGDKIISLLQTYSREILEPSDEKGTISIDYSKKGELVFDCLNEKNDKCLGSLKVKKGKVTVKGYAPQFDHYIKTNLDILGIINE